MRPVALASALPALLVAGTAAATEVWTSTRDVRACAVLDGNVVLAATTGGVARVKDGAVERVFSSLDGLPDTQAQALLVEPKGTFIGTEGGLALLTPTLAVAPVGTSHPHVRAIARHGGALYVGTWGDGVERLDGDTLVALPFAAAGPKERVKVSALLTHEGKLFAGTIGGLYGLEGGALRGLPDGPRDVFALGSHAGRLYIGALDGVRTLSPSGLRFEANDDVRAFAATGSDLWAGAFSSGLLHPGKSGLVKLPGVSPTGHVQALAASAAARCVGTREGLWIGAGAGALTRVERDELPSNDLTALATIGGKTFIGTYDAGLAVLEGKTARKVAGGDPRVNALAVSAGHVFVGTARGLYELDPQKLAVVGRVGELDGLPAADIHAVAPLEGGGVFVGTAKGAALVRGGTVTVLGKKQGLGGEAAWAVLETKKGTKLVGTSMGLYVLRKDAKVWERLSHVSGHLPDDWVTALVARGETVYAGTYAGGVAELVLGDKSGATTTLLGGGMINLAGLTLDGDTLLAATMEGLLARKLTGGAFVRRTAVALGRDVTAVLRTDAGLVVASRRGLSRAL